MRPNFDLTIFPLQYLCLLETSFKFGTYKTYLTVQKTTTAVRHVLMFMRGTRDLKENNMHQGNLWNANAFQSNRLKYGWLLCSASPVSKVLSVHGYKLTARARGGSKIFFRRGCTRLLLYFNTDKPHIFFLRNTSCIRKPQVISGVGGGGCAPPAPSP